MTILAWLLSLLPVFALVGLALAQPTLPSTEPLTQCQATLRVTQEMRGQAESVAATLLARAERAEVSLRQVQEELGAIKAKYGDKS